MYWGVNMDIAEDYTLEGVLKSDVTSVFSYYNDTLVANFNMRITDIHVNWTVNPVFSLGDVIKVFVWVDYESLHLCKTNKIRVFGDAQAITWQGQDKEVHCDIYLLAKKLEELDRRELTESERNIFDDEPLEDSNCGTLDNDDEDWPF